MAQFGTTAISYREDRADGGYAWDVRYDLTFDAAFEVDLRVDLVGVDPGSHKAVWENGVNDIWNQKVFFSNGSRLHEVLVDFEFVDAGAHQTVTVRSGSGGTTMTNWYLDDPWGPDFHDQVAAHEVGHMLGNFDEYADGATFGNFTRTGSLMSDLTVGKMDEYFWGVESFAEQHSGEEFTVVAARLGSIGHDSLTGTDGLDGFYALGGRDTVRSKHGNDFLDGGAGNDKLIGGGGSDQLIGGAGRDTLIGSRGPDSFVYRSSAESVRAGDLIRGFQQLVDKIDLAAVSTGTFTFTGEQAAFTAVSGPELRFLRTGELTEVFGDVNGDDATDFHIRLDRLLALTSADLNL